MNMTAAALAICTMVGQFAETAMTNRQAGVPASRQIAAMQAASPDIRDVVTGVIMLAYEQPRFHTPANQRRAIEDFRNDTETACLQSAN